MLEEKNSLKSEVHKYSEDTEIAKWILLFMIWIKYYL